MSILQQAAGKTDGREMAGQDKKPLETGSEMTHAGRYYQPTTDIYEMDDRLVVVMDIPGVRREDLAVTVENDVLSVDGKIDLGKYKDLVPVYTEYNIGHFFRRFTLSSIINNQNIIAQVRNGVLILELEKAEEARPRRIKVST